MRGGVPSAPVRFADRSGLLNLRPGQGVQQGRLTHARRSHQRHRLPRAAPRTHTRQSRRVQRVHGFHVQSGTNRARRIDECIHVLRQIRFSEHDDGFDVRVDRERKVALETRWVEFLVARADDEHDVHIRGEELNFATATGRHALEDTASVQQALGRTRGVEQQPITYGRTRFGCSAEPASTQHHLVFTAAAQNAQTGALNLHHPARHGLFGFLDRQLLLKERGPTQLFEIYYLHLIQFSRNHVSVAITTKGRTAFLSLSVPETGADRPVADDGGRMTRPASR